MIFLSLILVIVAAVTLVLGVFQDGLELIYVSIATCVAAMAVLGVGVLLRKREAASNQPASYAERGATDATTTSSASAVARAPVDPPQADEKVEVSRGSDTVIVRESDADEAAEVGGDRSEQGADSDERAPAKKAVVKKVAASPPAGRGSEDSPAPRRARTAGRVAGVAGGQVNVREGSAERPAAAEARTTPESEAAEQAVAARATAPSGTAKKTTATPATAKKATAKKATAKKATAKKATAKRAAAKKATAKKAAATPVPATPVPATPVTATPATAKKATAKKATAKKATAKKATAKKATAKRAAAKKATAKRATAKKATTKKATAKTATAKKASARKATGATGTLLSGVRGLGPAKRDALLARFGSEEAIASASVEEIAAIRGVGAGLARTIKDELS